MPKSTGTKPTESGAASSKYRATSPEPKKARLQIQIPLVRPPSKRKSSLQSVGSGFVNLAICLDDSGDADVIRGKTYRIITDRRAGADGYLRIVDESGGDYLYSKDRFLVIKKRLSVSVAKMLFS
jgi:hypothetical protein